MGFLGCGYGMGKGAFGTPVGAKSARPHGNDLSQPMGAVIPPLCCSPCSWSQNPPKVRAILSLPH